MKKGRGLKFRKKLNFIITFTYKIPTFLLVDPFSKWGRNLKNFSQKLKFLGFFQLSWPLSQSSLMEPTKNKEAALGAAKSVVYTENKQKKQPHLNNRFC